MSGIDDIPPALKLTVDLAALVANWRDLAARSQPARASAVVKANGYGLGLAPVVEALHSAGCRDFFTATLAEAVIARKHASDARIYFLNGLYPGLETIIRDHDLIPVLSSNEQVAHWSAECGENGEHPCAIQIDTGMNRLGLSPADALELAGDATRPASLAPVLLLSHLACGDVPDHPQNRRQVESFQKVAAAFEGIDSSLANSAGVYLGGDFLCDLTRPGIAIYGGECTEAPGSPLRPVARAEARIMQIREAEKGESVSYGGAEVLHRPTRIATCAVGYADGYLRSHSGAGVPLRATDCPPPAGFIAGARVPVLGRVTMDLTMFDITDLPANAVRVGDFIELFGPDMPLDDVARASGTIGYEVLTAIGSRYRRIYEGV